MPERRRQRNQELFRAVNERIREVGNDFDLSALEALEFLCECADACCMELLTLTLDEYERVPRTGHSFLVKPGHEQSEQRIVVSSAQYFVVESIASRDESVVL